MGIPSYYKKLCDSVPGLLRKSFQGACTHLWIDFNCMVYHCLRRPGAVPYQGEDTRVAWEAQFIESVCRYLERVVAQVQPTEGVFIAVDGVVPMAKIRQQRLRRFKSPWVAAEELRLGKREPGPRWDTNAITPGTAFMEALGKALDGLCKRHPKWHVSTAAEPGEGEQKCMDALRALPASKTRGHVVYGLDADLIVLSLLQTRESREMTLFREAVECGDVQYTESGEEQYRFLSINALADTLYTSSGSKVGRDVFLLNYCMAMSFLGNDFLPHGLTFTLRNGGHDALLQKLRDCGPLLDENGWTAGGLQNVLGWLASEEERWLRKALDQGKRIRNAPARGTGKELEYDEWFKTPQRCHEEACLVARWKDGERAVLRPDWERVYDDRWLHGASAEGAAQKTYLEGLDWIFRYYTGKPISYEWMYPWHLPPTWASLRSAVPCVSPAPTPPLKPQEQLALVLPLGSWNLVRDPALRALPTKVPSLWPTTFGFQMAGKRAMWECEALIPLFTPQRLRALLRL